MNEICTVVRGELAGEAWGWDVVATDGTKLAHYGTQSEADAYAEGYAAGCRAYVAAISGKQA